MYSEDQCDVCGRPAKHHETLLEAGAVVRKNYCGFHGRKATLAAFKAVLATQADHIPTNWLAPGVSDSNLRERINEASSIKEIARLLRINRIRDQFRQSRREP